MVVEIIIIFKKWSEKYWWFCEIVEFIEINRIDVSIDKREDVNNRLIIYDNKGETCI